MSHTNIVAILVPIVIIVLVFALIGFLLNQLQQKEIRIKNKLIRDGVIVEGSVDELREVSARGVYYMLRYRYNYNDRLYVRDEQVSFDLYRILNVGDKIHVRCLPERPWIARLFLTTRSEPT